MGLPTHRLLGFLFVARENRGTPSRPARPFGSGACLGQIVGAAGTPVSNHRSENFMNQRVVEATIDIAAPAETVWRTLLDFASYPQWSRFILAIEGEPQLGAHLAVQLDDGGGIMRMRPTIVIFNENVELRWRGVVGASFLLSAEHSFRLQQLPGGATRFTQSETFGGILVPLFWKRLDGQTRRAFHSFNDALCRRAEAIAPAHETTTIPTNGMAPLSS